MRKINKKQKLKKNLSKKNYQAKFQHKIKHKKPKNPLNNLNLSTISYTKE